MRNYKDAAFRAKLSQSCKAYRASLTPEQRQESAIKASKAALTKWQSLSPEEKAARILKSSLKLKATIAARSEEQKQKHKAQLKAALAKHHHHGNEELYETAQILRRLKEHVNENHQ